MKCIFEASELSVTTGSSLCTIEDLRCYARRMYCRGKEIEEDHTKNKVAQGLGTSQKIS